MPFIGADVEQLNKAATTLTNKATEITTAAKALKTEIMALDWKGPDAEKFKSDWNLIDANIMKVVESINQNATTIKNNASEQTTTSSK